MSTRKRNKISLYLTRFGIVTLTVNKWSPRIDGLFSFGAPFFARTSTSPGWVPAGICSSVIPSTVFTCLDVRSSVNQLQTKYQQEYFYFFDK